MCMCVIGMMDVYVYGMMSYNKRRQLVHAGAFARMRPAGVYRHVLIVFLYWHTLHLTSQHHRKVQLHLSDTRAWWVL